LRTMGNTPIKDGGPAFPMQDASAIHAYASARVEGVVGVDERDRAYIKAKAEAIGGMSLRDWFAGQATDEDIDNHRQWEYNRGWYYVYKTNPKLSREKARYAYADAMLAAREGGAK